MQAVLKEEMISWIAHNGEEVMLAQIEISARSRFKAAGLPSSLMDDEADQFNDFISEYLGGALANMQETVEHPELSLFTLREMVNDRFNRLMAKPDLKFANGTLTSMLNQQMTIVNLAEDLAKKYADYSAFDVTI
jgi:hypothetical protein